MVKLWVALSIFVATINFIQCVEEECQNVNFYKNEKMNPDPVRPTGIGLIGFREYMLQVVQELVYSIEDYGLSNLQLDDFNQTINWDAFALTAVGDINYTGGFVDTIQDAWVNKEKFSYYLNTETYTGKIYCELNLMDVTIFYNFHANLTTGPISGTVEMFLASVTFSVTSYKSYINNTVWGEISATGTGKPKLWDFDPITPQIEVIRKMTHPPNDGQHFFLDDFDKIAETTLLELLNHIIMKIPYPELCYDCSVY